MPDNAIELLSLWRLWLTSAVLLKSLAWIVQESQPKHSGMDIRSEVFPEAMRGAESVIWCVRFAARNVLEDRIHYEYHFCS